MSKVVFVISMSIDGYVAGTDVSETYPMGQNGMRLHDWMFNTGTDIDEKILNERMESTGAVITGERTYTIAIDIDAGWGGVNPFPFPNFVVLREAPAKRVEGFTYVTDGIESALEQAKVAAGEKNVLIMGGAGIAGAYLKAGLIDEFHVHIVSAFFGEGIRLFERSDGSPIELERLEVIESPGATYIRFRVVK